MLQRALIAVVLSLFSHGSLFAQTPAKPKAVPDQVPVQADGTIELPTESVPVSKFLSPEARTYLIQHLHDMQDPERTYAEKGVPRFLAPYLERQKTLFKVGLEDTRIGGVHAYVFT